MAYSLIRPAMVVVFVFLSLMLGGCAKSISVSPQQVVLTAAQPSAQVTVEMKWPHTVAWNAYQSTPGALAVSPDFSYEWSQVVTVTASDFSVTRSHKVLFEVGDEDNPTAVLDVLVQSNAAKTGVSILNLQMQ